MNLVQVAHPARGRRVALVEGRALILLEGAGSIYDVALGALEAGMALEPAVRQSARGEALDYHAVYQGGAEWTILPAIDHPAEPARLMVSGTGLTHLASAANRQAMHAAGTSLTDSMKMYQAGVEGGRPSAGRVGVAPEWFYKGTGAILRGHGQPLAAPAHAEECGEEPEIAGIYVVDSEGRPRRLGMAIGNEFSDHRFEKRNYLYLAASKLMPCAVGPELVLDPDFSSVAGRVSIERDGAAVWSKNIRSGEAAMCHSLANLEHHHFKHTGHRRPGDLHVHFYGADAFSFGEGLILAEGDVMEIGFEGFGRPLRNPLHIDRDPGYYAALKL